MSCGKERKKNGQKKKHGLGGTLRVRLVKQYDNYTSLSVRDTLKRFR